MKHHTTNTSNTPQFSRQMLSCMQEETIATIKQEKIFLYQVHCPWPIRKRKFFLIVKISYFFEDTIYLDFNMITLKTSKNLTAVKKPGRRDEETGGRKKRKKETNVSLTCGTSQNCKLFRANKEYRNV